MLSHKAATRKWCVWKGSMATRRPTPKKRSNARTRKVAKPSSEMEEVWVSTRALVKALLETLAKGIDSPNAVPEHWERLFGTKDSAVANLQKLVALLVELRSHFHETRHEDDPQGGSLDGHELDLLEAWLEKQKSTGDA